MCSPPPARIETRLSPACARKSTPGTNLPSVPQQADASGQSSLNDTSRRVIPACFRRRTACSPRNGVPARSLAAETKPWRPKWP